MCDEGRRDPDPFEDFAILKAVADDRDALLHAHCLAFPVKSGKTTQYRAKVVEWLMEMLGSSSAAVTFHVAKALQEITEGKAKKWKAIRATAQSFWDRSRHADEQAEWLKYREKASGLSILILGVAELARVRGCLKSGDFSYPQVQFGKTTRKVRPEDTADPRHVRLVSRVADCIRADRAWWDCRRDELFGSKNSFPPSWPDAVNDAVEEFLDATPIKPDWWADYMAAFRSGKGFQPPSWNEALKLIERDPKLGTELKQAVRSYFPDQLLPDPKNPKRRTWTPDARADHLAAQTRSNLYVTIITNSDDWFRRGRDPATKTKQNHAPRLRPGQSRKRKADVKANAIQTRTWRGFLLGAYPTIMKRAAEYDRRPKGLPKKKTVGSLTPPQSGQDEPTILDVCHSNEPAPDDAAERNEAIEAARRAVRKLTAEVQAVVWMKYEGELSDSEIGKRLSPPRTEKDVKSILKNALDKLGGDPGLASVAPQC